MILPFIALSAVEQLVEHLREEIRRGVLSEEMPGVNQLAVGLGCSARTVHAAVKQLEREGFLQGQGAGRRCRIVSPDVSAPRVLRVKILLYDRNDGKNDYILNLRHQISEVGHIAVIASKSLIDLGMDAGRVEGFVNGAEADAWVVLAGSRAILEGFAERSTPAFALFGRVPSVDIAGTGPQKSPALVAAVRRLAGLGHTRIVCLTHEERRKPNPGLLERVFLGELEKRGIPVGPYNLPDWEDNPAGFFRCLNSLFGTTPPTALIISTFELFVATQQFLLSRGIRVPKEVSLVCNEPHLVFEWSTPAISHIDFDSDIWVRHIVRWVDGVARGKNDRRKVFNEARFVEGGTIGPAARGRGLL